MLSLEVIVANLSSESGWPHPEFRLFLSSMPTPKFPVSVLQNSVKVTNEPPKGLKANVKRALIEMEEDFFEQHVLEQDWRSMLFGICMFHAIIQERKKFGPLGWNITYEFNNSDRECALMNLQMFCEDGTIPWDALEYITSNNIDYLLNLFNFRTRIMGCSAELFDMIPTATFYYRTDHHRQGVHAYTLEPKWMIQFGFRAISTHRPSDCLITYGGRVTDMWDQRCLTTILKIFFSPQTLEDGYVYSESGRYYCPRSKKLETYRDYIESLPNNENPENKESLTLIKTIVDVQPRAAGSGGGETPDQIVWRISDQTRSKIAKSIDKSLINPELMIPDDMGQLHSLTTVLIHETDRFNTLLHLIHHSLNELQKAIKGIVVMSEEFEEVFTSFINNKVPNMWHKKGYNSLKTLGSWIHDLTLRVDFITKWLVDGAQPSSWVSGLFFPQGLLTGSLQSYARRFRVPIDALMFDFFPIPLYLSQDDIYKQNNRKKSLALVHTMPSPRRRRADAAPKPRHVTKNVPPRRRRRRGGGLAATRIYRVTVRRRRGDSAVTASCARALRVIRGYRTISYQTAGSSNWMGIPGEEGPSAYEYLELPDDGVNIHGLFIDAGRWDIGLMRLVDPLPGQMNPPMPVVWFKPVLTLPKPDPRYEAPLYKTSERAGVLSTTGHSTNFVLPVLLPSNHPQSYWIIRGTALLTQISD
uniref:SFRICE_006427 n=1 Tax=Spodoptera frugiperda TaxID=7108 RepID=A0A2H1VTU9_SPOFR